MRRLRVAHVTPYFCPWGGIEVAVYELSKRLSEFCDVEILASKPGKDLTLPWGAKARFFRSFDWANLGLGARIRYPLPPGLFAAIARGPYDLVHVHGHHYPTSFLARRACRASGKKYVLTVHSPSTALLERLSVRAVRRILDKEIRRTVGEAEACIAVTEKVRRYLRECFGRDDALLIRHGIEVEFVPEGEDIVFVGRLVPYKHPDVFLRAMAVIAGEIPARFHVVGGGPMRGTLEGLARRLGIRERVVFWGTRTPMGVRKILREARVFVAPYLTGGLAVLEALAMGRVVVGLPGGEPTDEVIVPLREVNPEEVAERTLSLYNDRGKRRELRERAREILERYYSWEKNVREHLAVYRRVLSAL